jgi:hypothetical protein
MTHDQMAIAFIGVIVVWVLLVIVEAMDERKRDCDH